MSGTLTWAGCAPRPCIGLHEGCYDPGPQAGALRALLCVRLRTPVSSPCLQPSGPTSLSLSLSPSLSLSLSHARTHAHVNLQVSEPPLLKSCNNSISLLPSGVQLLQPSLRALLGSACKEHEFLLLFHSMYFTWNRKLPREKDDEREQWRQGLFERTHAPLLSK